MSIYTYALFYKMSKVFYCIKSRLIAYLCCYWSCRRSCFITNQFFSMKNSYYKLFITVLIVLACARTEVWAQNYNQTDPFLKANAFWAWCDENGLDFSGGAPVHVPTAMDIPSGGYFPEGAAAVSDPLTGSLLFYTNGKQVWNKNHNVMQNGDSLFGNWRGTTQQGVCIVPFIGDADKYYIFSLGLKAAAMDGADSAFSGLYYSIVDVSLNNGNGAVVAGEKNIPLDTITPFNEAMIAVPGNNCNIWLITHGGGLNPEYFVFEITSSGISTSPVKSPGLLPKISLNHLSVSPDRTRICMSDLFPPTFAQIGLGIELYPELMEFDPNSGTLSNGIALNTPSNTGWYGIYTSAFSPNGDVLYSTALNQEFGGTPHTTIMQMDLSAYDSSAINSSITFIDTLLPGIGSIGYPHTISLKSYKDSIYLLYANKNYLGRINQPNNIGLACDFVEQAFQLPYPYRTNISFATALSEVVYPMSPSNHSIALDTAICGSLVLTPAEVRPNTTYHWNTGATDSILSVNEVGTYWVAYGYLENNCLHQQVDTFKISPGTVNPPAEITIDVDTLGTTVSYTSYQWMLNGNLINGATGSTYTVLENGNYQVIVSNEFGCIDTSGIYEVTNKETGIYTPAGEVAVNIYPNPTRDIVYIDSKADLNFSLFTFDGREIKRNIPGKAVDLNGLPQGLYLLKLFDKNGQLVYLSKVTKLN